MVGLTNVENTSDANKPISTATQAVLDLKENTTNKSINIITDAASTTKYPSVKLIKDYVDTQTASTQIAANSITDAKIESVSASKLLGTIAIANGGTGSTTSDLALTSLGAASIASPTFTGIPKAPTAVSGTNSVQIATTAFVANAISTTPNSLIGYTDIINGIRNVGIGFGTAGNSIGAYNTLIGAHSMAHVSSGTDNVMLGAQAARYISRTYGDWATNSQSMNRSVFIGSMTRASNNNDTNEIVIGYDALGNGSNTIQLGNTAITNTKTNGTITAGTVTYPNVHGTTGQVLSTTGSGALTWATPIPKTAIASDQFSSTTDQTSFTLSQTPLNAKIWMFINGARTNNNAYSVSGTTVTYTAANNNGYTLVINDRIQFDYCY